MKDGYQEIVYLSGGLKKCYYRLPDRFVKQQIMILDTHKISTFTGILNAHLINTGYNNGSDPRITGYL